MSALIRNHDVASSVQDRTFEYGSDWVVLARRAADIDVLRRDTRWRPLIAATRDQLWTDDYSNLLSVIKW
jgi:hypothetical protein